MGERYDRLRLSVTSLSLSSSLCNDGRNQSGPTMASATRLMSTSILRSSRSASTLACDRRAARVVSNALGRGYSSLHMTPASLVAYMLARRWPQRSVHP